MNLLVIKKKKAKNLVFHITTSLLLLFFIVNCSYARELEASDLTSIVDDIKYWYGFGSVFCLIMALGAFVFNIIRLGSASTNTKKREMAIRGLIISASVAALVPMGIVIYGIMTRFMVIG